MNFSKRYSKTAFNIAIIIVINNDNKYLTNKFIFFSSSVILFCQYVSPRTIKKETPIMRIQIKKKRTILKNLCLPEYLKFSKYKSSGSGGSSISNPFFFTKF